MKYPNRRFWQLGLGSSYLCGNAEFEFLRMKVFLGFQFEKVLINLLSKIACGHVTLFQVEKY